MLAPKNVFVNGKKIEVTGAVKNAFMHDRDADRERKRRKYNAKVGHKAPETVSLEQMYEETKFEPRSDDDVEEEAACLLLNKQVRKAVAELPEKKRAVIELRYFKNMTVREAADVLGIPFTTAEGREKSALKTLREVLEKFI